MATRLQKGMTVEQAITKMVDGNPDAYAILGGLIGMTRDLGVPQAGIAALQLLDKMGIYSYEIYGLWNDVCNRNTFHVMVILAAYCKQVQGVTLDTIKYAIDNHDAGPDIPSIIESARTCVTTSEILSVVADRPIFINDPSEG